MPTKPFNKTESWSPIL